MTTPLLFPKSEDPNDASKDVLMRDGKPIMCPVRSTSELIPNELGRIQMIEGAQACKRTCAWFMKDEDRDGKVLFEGCAEKHKALSFAKLAGMADKLDGLTKLLG